MSNKLMQNPKITAILLAAGCSSRFGSGNKLLEEMDGVPILLHALRVVLDSSVQQCVLVTGHQATAVEAIVKNHSIEIIPSPDYRLGISRSIKAGIQAVDEDSDAAVIVLGDMPSINKHVIDALVSAYDPGIGNEVCVPTFRGRRGNPVLWGRRLFTDLCMLEGDIGGKQLMDRYEDIIKECECSSEAVLFDVDTIADLTLRRPVTFTQENSD